jgi:hypothetical protein
LLITLLQWSDKTHISVLWTLIASAEGALSFANKVHVAPAFPSMCCATSSSPSESRSTAYPFSKAMRRQPSVNGTETTSSAAAARFSCRQGFQDFARAVRQKFIIENGVASR